MTRKIHYVSGIVICIFAIVHIINHLMILKSETAHLHFMELARQYYRHPVGESILFIAIAVQVVSGIMLVKKKWKTMHNIYDRIQVYSGIYLVYFLIGHTIAVLIGRHMMKLDTNLYFGASVVNNTPALFYYIFHYGLAIIAFFAHVGSVHRVKSASFLGSKQSNYQCWFIMGFGVVLAVVIVAKMMDVTIPQQYQYLPFGKY